MEAFQAFRINADSDGVRAGFETLSLADLTEGEVVIRAAYSDVNYKDALAATGKGKILRKSPLVGGIDVSGYVVESSDHRFTPGDAVAVCGAGLSETLDGGYAEYARVPADYVVKLPAGLDVREAMMIGTAGFTAALAIQRMEDNGQTIDNGPILVNGATGGVGSLIIDMLDGIGYEVHALTGKADSERYLRELGAAEVLLRQDLDHGKRPLERAIWGGGVDNLGGDILTWLTRTVKPWGNIACIGLASSIKLETTVMPLILRGVSLLGINSIEMPSEVRESVWSRLASDLKPRHLDRIVTRTVALSELPSVFDAYIEGTNVGRVLVSINPEAQ